MASFAAAAAAKSVFRSTSVRSAAARLGSEAKSAASAARSQFRATSVKPPSTLRLFRGISSSVFVEMAPFHSANASAVMTSLLSISRCSCGWLPEGKTRSISWCKYLATFAESSLDEEEE
ncbi:uncharacterized protein [Rutidosis leptorrhynchoides]|uniref:uncharacterized protein n=1 Tax=Rutidosis leptorrhynchoides TaxID=125765 RepID=UPI003A998549